MISEAVETIRKPSISDLPDQPAAQPPAVVGQGELLPVPAKAKRKKPRKNPPVAMTEDWWPMPKTIDNLEKDFGIPRAFTEVCVWEFITHWMGDGRGRPGWDSTFISSVQYSWNKEQKREKSERYTDAAGQPISERDATTRERNKRVAAALANGLFDNFDLKTKV